MNKLSYPIGVEITADFGMFADPASGSEAVSYPMPPISACMGILESILRVRGVRLTIVAEAICHMPQWTKYTYNSRNLLRKEDTIKKDQACQIHEVVLSQPHFQILALAENFGEQHPRWVHHSNPAHGYQEQFFKRIGRGENRNCPSMGRKEFLCTYAGPIRSRVEQAYTTCIPTMVQRMFNEAGKVDVLFKQNVMVKNGVVEWVPNLVAFDTDGKLAFIEQIMRKNNHA